MSGFAIPVCLLLFCWLTVGAGAAVDKDLVNLYGFPLAWYTPSLVSSGEFEVALGPMLVDLFVYGLLVWGLAVAARRWVVLRRKTVGILTVALWMAALGSVGVSSLTFFGDSHATAWRLNSGVPPDAKKSYFVSVGIQPRPSLDRRK